MFGKIKNIFLKKKALIIALAVLVVVGWFFAIYFGIKANSSGNAALSGCFAKMEKLNTYASILDQSNKLAREKKSFTVLENDIRSLNNGTLLATWQQVVLGGNKQQDLNDYFDTLIDSLVFFSK
jgi:hypothetical protein